MSSHYDIGTIEVLWRRDLMRFFRQPTRIAGALGQPLVVWLVLGSGLAATFALPGVRLTYLEYFFPGVLVMVLLFASIFASVSIIEDRHQGFLQAVLAGPGSRAALVLGKCLGAATVALVQVVLLLALAPLAGFAYGDIDWSLLSVVLVATALGLTALGFAAAWIIDGVQGYHAIQMMLLVPLWVISGAMFPPAGAPGVFRGLMVINPVAYAVSGVRQALHGGTAPTGTVPIDAPLINVLVVTGFAAVALAVAIVAATRLRSKRA